jgi:glyoxylase-like metal-dependent hydrolase (beta-lactamase superfamily II)
MTLQIPIPEAYVLRRPASGEVFVVDDEVAVLRTGIAIVVLLGRRDAVDRYWLLVDCGIRGYASSIIKAAEKCFGGGSAPAAIILTHGHFDHVGALEELATHWDVPVLAHIAEHGFLNGTESYPPANPLAGGGLMTLLSPLFPRSPVNVSDRLRQLSFDGSIPSLSGWTWIHTPGPTPGHISLWNSTSGMFVAGDAVTTTGQESAYEVIAQSPELHGPPRYFTPDWDEARRSVERISGLPVRTLVTGHGPPLHGDDLSSRLVELAACFDEIARPINHGGR